MPEPTKNVEILECTIRDGNYSVNFKFTEKDTALLIEQLSGLGFKWIEIGHGLGLGASEAGKGDMPASDMQLLKAAQARNQGAQIGMFFIPEIGTEDHLKQAADAGLDFVRVGYDATNIEKAYSYVKLAKSLGMMTCLNFMKTYAITPKEFALRSKEAEDAGADIVYCVDSAGSMLGRDVADYIDAAREQCECKLGFHGHNNLMMAIDNCLTAYEHGATFLDTTLCGLGRSAGNAPTEILVAVLERMNIDSKIDLFVLMDVIEKYMWPLVKHTRPHDMVGVVSGFAQFHSGYLKKVAHAAQKHDVDLRRLIAAVSKKSIVTLEEDYLEEAVKDLAGTKVDDISERLISFDVPEVSDNRLGNSKHSIEKLVDGLRVTHAKRAGSTMALQLVPSQEQAQDLIMSEYVIENSNIVMGRIRYGSAEVLKSILQSIDLSSILLFVNQTEGWAKDTAQQLKLFIDPDQILPIRDDQIRKNFLVESLDQLAFQNNFSSLLIYGTNSLINHVLDMDLGYEKVFVYGGSKENKFANEKVVSLGSLNDCLNLNIRFDVILCASNPTDSDARVLQRTLNWEGLVLSMGTYADVFAHQTLVNQSYVLNMNLAYIGVAERFHSQEMFQRSNAAVIES